MRGNRQILRSKYERIPYVHIVPKWRVSTGALLGAVLSVGVEIVWRGFSANWELFSDRAQELITLEIMIPSIVAGGVCGALICLIRNQQKNAQDARD